VVIGISESFRPAFMYRAAILDSRGCALVSYDSGSRILQGHVPNKSICQGMSEAVLFIYARPRSRSGGSPRHDHQCQH
jgi:hypothetical protein